MGCRGSFGRTTGHRLRRQHPFPPTLPELEYPGHFETRYVSENGGIRWKKCWVNVATTLAHEWVGLELVGDGLWDVYFSRLRLGRLDQRRMRIEDPYGRWTRWEVLTMSPDKSVTDVTEHDEQPALPTPA